MTHTADNTDACLCTWGQLFEGELLGVTQRITVTSRRCPEHGAKPRHASAADNTDRQETAMLAPSPECAPTSPTGRMSTHCQHGYTGCNTVLCTCQCHDDQWFSSSRVGGTTTSSEEQTHG